jgi:peptidoglycan/xylan/chitin deacetylase (PgdA/CDA1 family)
MTPAHGLSTTNPAVRSMAGGALGASAIGAAAYWTFMSPYAQTLGPFPYRGTNPTAPARTVALTFDDGPNEPFTSQIADYLNQQGIRATFFQVGRCVQRQPHVTRALAQAGHLIGNHSYSHAFTRCWGRHDIRDQVVRAQEVFARHLGRQPALYRPPWLARTPALFEVLRERALQPVSGEFCHSLEVFQPSPARIARGALAKVRSGSIIIFHDGYDDKGADRGSTVAAVKLVVQALLTRGYRFETVDRMLGLPSYGD